MNDFLFDLTRNTVLWTAALAWFIAQFLKFTIELIRHNRISLYVLLARTGGMPSSHSAFVVSLMIVVGFKEGFGSGLFAVSAALAMVTMADAAGIRRAAGKHAAALNMLIEHLNDPGISLDRKLRELLGHTPVEVAAGALLGIGIGVASSYYHGFV